MVILDLAGDSLASVHNRISFLYNHITNVTFTFFARAYMESVANNRGNEITFYDLIIMLKFYNLKRLSKNSVSVQIDNACLSQCKIPTLYHKETVTISIVV